MVIQEPIIDIFGQTSIIFTVSVSIKEGHPFHSQAQEFYIQLNPITLFLDMGTLIPLFVLMLLK
jgi:hypothetical protein